MNIEEFISKLTDQVIREGWWGYNVRDYKVIFRVEARPCSETEVQDSEKFYLDVNYDTKEYIIKVYHTE